MKLVFAADLHGDSSLYDRLLAFLDREKPDVLLLGGDLFAYDNSPESQVRFVLTTVQDFVFALPCPLFWIPGNIDWPAAVAALDRVETKKSMRLTLDSNVDIAGIPLIGYPWINPSPFRIKLWEKPDLTIDQPQLVNPAFACGDDGTLCEVSSDYFGSLSSIEQDFQAVSTKGIWLVHVPPHGGSLDQLSSHVAAGKKRHVGSVAVRRAIERVQPALTLHGHIHEAPTESGAWVERIGRTVAVNAGRTDLLNAVAADFDRWGELCLLTHTLYGDWELRL